MSRGFVNEDDQEEIPMIPPRADLPEGIINYVTQVGMNELILEREQLIKERDQLDSSNERERRINSNFINSKLNLLNDRIGIAKIIDLETQPQAEVRFGATVKLKIGSNKTTQSYQIVGVDEAEISKGKISFLSPIARILIDKKVGETAVLKLTKEERIFEVLDIQYVN